MWLEESLGPWGGGLVRQARELVLWATGASVEQGQPWTLLPATARELL